MTNEQIERMRTALKHSKEKLELYRAAHGGEYVGGMEYTRLIAEIDKLLSDSEPGWKVVGERGGMEYVVPKPVSEPDRHIERLHAARTIMGKPRIDDPYLRGAKTLLQDGENVNGPNCNGYED